MLSNLALQEYKKIFKEEVGEELADDEATKLGINLLTLLNHIYRPVKQDWLNEYKNCNDKTSRKIN